MEDLHASFDDLMIDVVGPMAIAAGVLARDGTVDGSSYSGRARSTVVFVDHGASG